MKKLLVFIFIVHISITLKSQSVGIGTTTPDSSAVLELSSSSKGLLIPRMSDIEMRNIPEPAFGLLVLNTTDSSIYIKHDSGWAKLIIPSGDSKWAVNGNDIYNTNPLNVGIGTAYPTHARLEITGRVGATVAMFGSDAFGVGISANNPEIGFNYFYNNGTYTMKAGYAANFGMYPASGDVYLGSFNGNQSASDFGAISGYKNILLLKQNGMVGIGNPTYYEGQLNIAGDDGIYLYSGDNITTVGRIGTDVNGNLLIKSQSHNSLALFKRDILLNPFVNSFTDVHRGNVGIRSSSASHAILEVADVVGATVGMFGNNKFGTTINADNPGVGFNYYYNGTAKTIKAGYAGLVEMDRFNGDIYIGNFNGNQSSGNFGNITGFQYNLLVKQNGNIGIGNTNPQAKLDVSGDIKTSGGIYANETGGLNMVPLGILSYSFTISGSAVILNQFTNIAGSLATGTSYTLSIGVDDEISYSIHLDYSKVAPYASFVAIGSPGFDNDGLSGNSMYAATFSDFKDQTSAKINISYRGDSFGFFHGHGRFIVYGIK